MYKNWKPDDNLNFLTNILERGSSIFSFVFALNETLYYFGANIFLNNESIILNYLYTEHIIELQTFQETYEYIIFGTMIFLFTICSTNKIPLTRFIRYNTIQAILLGVICSCVGSIFMYLPMGFREGIMGALLTNFLFLLSTGVIIYSSILIFFGKFPTIPIISEAARIQIQKSRY